MQKKETLNLQFESGEPVYDAIVMGSGPAGLAGAIYLARANLRTLVLEAEKKGGRLNEAHLIENYPGFASVSGIDLAGHMVLQAEAFGAKILCPMRAVRFELQSNPKIVWTREKEYRADAVLIAIGVQRRRVEIKGARELLGMGISYCPICDGTFFKDRDVALIGEDDEAIQDGLYLSELVNKIHLIPGTLTPRYDKGRLEQLLSKGKTQYWHNFWAVEIVGKPTVEKLRVQALDAKQESEIPVKGIFISGENTPVTQMLADAGVKTDQTGCIGVDAQMQTNVEGVYAAGDATCSRKYQVAVSVGQGTIAALNIIKQHTEKRKNR